MYGTYPEVTPLSYYFLSNPVVLWKLMKLNILKNTFFSPLFWHKCVFLELNVDLFNSLEISTSNKPHCRIIWLNIKGFECEKVVVSYPYTFCSHDMRHISVGPTLWLRHKPNRGAIRIFININLHYITANVVSFSLKQIRVWWAFSSSKRKIIWKAYIALIFNKCPKMHENECNLAGNFELIRRYSSYQIYTVDFSDN